jgi:multidrug efflux pump subunit AcrA (membrane-fusion protein)
MAVGRPAAGNGESTTYLFRIEPGGGAADRVAVRLGRTSATEVEIVSGLAVGDRVILSDMSQWDHVNRVRLRR